MDLKSIERPQNGDEIVEASDLHLRNLTDCRIDLMDFSSRVRERDSERSLERKQEFKSQFKALQIRNLKNCLVYVGEVEGSVMIHGCERCVILVGCRQVSCQRSSNSFHSLFLFLSLLSQARKTAYHLLSSSLIFSSLPFLPSSLVPNPQFHFQPTSIKDSFNYYNRKLSSIDPNFNSNFAITFHFRKPSRTSSSRL